MEEYFGVGGYISQKENEIERIKKAQILSDRMQKNFHTTLEITKNVDVLTDTIVPGIKKLMRFNLPELIENINEQCDKESALLEIKG